MKFEDALELMRLGELVQNKEFKAVYRLKGDVFEYSYVDCFGKWKLNVYFSGSLILSDKWEIFKK